LIYHKKLKDYKNYFGKFVLFTIISSAFFILAGFFALIYSGAFLREYIFGDLFLVKDFVKTLIFLLLAVFVTYLGFNFYVYSNKYKILDVFKKTFSFKKFLLFPILIVVFVISFLILLIGVRVNPTLVPVLLVLVSLLFLWYKIYLTNKLKVY